MTVPSIMNTIMRILRYNHGCMHIFLIYQMV